MTTLTIDGERAWRALAASKVQQWEDIAPRFAAPLFSLTHEAKFPLEIADRFFCIGSCFARNVEEHLIYRGVEVLSRQIISPKEEWPGPRPNGLVNKFTTHSMVQEIDWLFEPPADIAGLMVETAQGFLDLQLCPGVPPAPLGRAVERRAYLMQDYFGRIRDADVVVLTLGLNEVWRDFAANRYLNAPPTLWSTRKRPGRFVVEITDVAQNLAQLEHLRERLKVINPEMKIIVTVSPVPMSATFSGQDIAVANAYSKATLLVAARSFAGAHADVDYFPSYELVSLSPRPAAYGADCLHPTNAVVGAAMELFLRSYMKASPEAPEGFVDFAYLEANPDVELAVRQGKFTSGFEHWIHHGRAEGRALRPAENSERMIAAGI